MLRTIAIPLIVLEIAFFDFSSILNEIIIVSSTFILFRVIHTFFGCKKDSMFNSDYLKEIVQSPFTLLPLPLQPKFSFDGSCSKDYDE